MIRSSAFSALVFAACVSAPAASAQILLKAPPPAPSPPLVRAQPPESVAAAEVRELEKTLRDLLLKNLPEPIVKSASGWGKQQDVVVGGRLKGMPIKELRNDGTWRRMSVSASNPAQTLAIGITDAIYPDPGRLTFTAMIGLDCRLKFEQQLWQNGLRLYSGETRGRCRAALLLKCEVVSRTEKKPGSLLPDVVFRVRATEAQLFYQDVVIEHTAGIGGDGAKLLGEATLYTLKHAKPDVERDLLTKANAAIVKAADSKELRVSFDALVKGQIPGIAKPR